MIHMNSKVLMWKCMCSSVLQCYQQVAHQAVSCW